MTNNVQIIGRIANELKIEDGKINTTIAVPRNYKNEDGIYETDFIDCVLKGNIAENTFKYCLKGDLIAIRGRIERLSTNDPLVIVADKLTFLSSKKEVA